MLAHLLDNTNQPSIYIKENQFDIVFLRNNAMHEVCIRNNEERSRIRPL